MESATLIIGGDLAPTKSNYSYFEAGNINELIDDRLLSLLETADYRIFNLELPLTDIEKPIKKDGPNLMAPISALKGIKLLNPTVLSLANNHILDHDEHGMYQTIDLLSKSNISWVGAGKDLHTAAKPIIIKRGDLRIGIYACAEYEFSIAEENKAGANPFDPLESPDHVADLKSRCDYVVVLYHGGKELYRYPSPYLQKVCRKIAEKGADLIICQHSHCIGAFEKYNGSVIVYGQGNFLFDMTDKGICKTSLLIKVTFGDNMSVDFLPFCKKRTGIALPESDVSRSILKDFNERSNNLSLPGFIETEYEKFCISRGLFYIGAIAGLGRIPRKLNELLHGIITRQIYSLKKLNSLQNMIECEAHRELILRYLRIIRKR